MQTVASVLLFGASACTGDQEMLPWPQSYAYVLQAENLADERTGVVDLLRDCGRDLIILDALFDGEATRRWTPEELTAIRRDKAGRRIAAYLSIGEAEDYRPYWQAAWDRDNDGVPEESAPPFLLGVNPDWPGNYRVRYWREDWQALIRSELDRILTQGFDGVFLDIVDGFEFFEQDGEEFIDNRRNPETGNTYREDMRDFVLALARHSRATHRDFLVIPQNGTQLLAFPQFRKTIDAIALEDLFVDGDKKQPEDHWRHVLQLLEPAREARLPILLTSYATNDELRHYVRQQAARQGITLLLTDRKLDRLGIPRR